MKTFGQLFDRTAGKYVQNRTPSEQKMGSLIRNNKNGVIRNNKRDPPPHKMATDAQQIGVIRKMASYSTTKMGPPLYK